MMTVRSTTETSMVGMRNAMPVSLPCSSGMARPTALAAPVLAGMQLTDAARPPRQSFLLGPSCVGWVAVMAWTVVINPLAIPNSSLTTLAIGARQLVVQDALDTTVALASRVFSLTPMTMVGTWSGLLVGAEMTVFFAPASTCLWAPS